MSADIRTAGIMTVKALELAPAPGTEGPRGSHCECSADANEMDTDALS